MEKLLLIYNPTSGKGRAVSDLPVIIDLFTKDGYLVTAYPTQGKGDAARVARELSPGFDRVVCCGGDGTLSETVSGLIALEKPPVLGYIAMGSTNDCARTLFLPRELEYAAAIASREGTPRLWDVGELNKAPFFYIAAFGAFTQVAYDTPQELKNILGHLAYVISGIASIPTIAPYHLRIEYDGKRLEGDYYYGMICNTLSVGGILSLPNQHVAVDDGLFEVILVKQPVNFSEFLTGLQTMLPQGSADFTRPGTISEGSMILSFKASKLRITSDREIAWTLDGEYGGSSNESLIENRSRAVTIMQGPQP